MGLQPGSESGGIGRAEYVTGRLSVQSCDQTQPGIGLYIGSRIEMPEQEWIRIILRRVDASPARAQADLVERIKVGGLERADID